VKVSRCPTNKRVNLKNTTVAILMKEFDKTLVANMGGKTVEKGPPR
jgi:hypothetical protein